MEIASNEEWLVKVEGRDWVKAGIKEEIINIVSLNFLTKRKSWIER